MSVKRAIVASNKPVICLVGPTASGKTDLSLALAEKMSVHLISVDSANIYCDMDIGTAKPSKALLEKYPHALVDILPPTASYSAADFVQDAVEQINLAHQNNILPVLVGGTMLYFKAILRGISELPTADPIIRASLAERLQSDGVETLHKALKSIDPKTASRLKPQDKQRILRALEVYEISKIPLSEWLEKTTTPAIAPEQVLTLSLMPPERSILHELIEKRFDSMLELGFENEVKTLLSNYILSPDMPSMRSVGYRQMWEYIRGEVSFSVMREKSIAATRQLAKRQLTWINNWDVPTHSCTMIGAASGGAKINAQSIQNILRQIQSFIAAF